MSRDIAYIDTTVRDGNQSLWSATGLTTPDVLAIAPTIDRVGYHALDFTSSTHMAVSVRFHREDPWERLRLVSAAMPSTPLGIITTGMRFISWVPADEEVMRLSFKLCVRNGIRRIQIAEPSNDPERLRRLAAMARAEGAEEVVIGLTYSISDVHTHDYYAERAAALADCARHGPALPQGSRRAAHARCRPRAGARAAGGRRHPTARAAQPLHDRTRAVRVSGRGQGRLRRRTHRVRTAVARDLAAGRPEHRAQPGGGRLRACA